MRWEDLNREYERLWGRGPQSDVSPNATIVVEEERLGKKSLEELLAEYADRPKNLKPQRKSQTALVFDRDPAVVVIRKKLARFQCEVEGCLSQHFQTERGDFYVEVHHLDSLATGGSDIPENTVALCPTHHRLIHFGQDRHTLISELRRKRAEEPTFGRLSHSKSPRIGSG